MCKVGKACTTLAAARATQRSVFEPLEFLGDGTAQIDAPETSNADLAEILAVQRSALDPPTFTTTAVFGAVSSFAVGSCPFSSCSFPATRATHRDALDLAGVVLALIAVCATSCAAMTAVVPRTFNAAAELALVRAFQRAIFELPAEFPADSIAKWASDVPI